MGNKGGRCVGLTTLSRLCAGYLEILGGSMFWSPKGLYGPTQELFLHRTDINLGWRTKK